MRSRSLPSPNITIDSSAPLEEILPAPRNATAQTPSAFVDELPEVPELMLTDSVMGQLALRLQMARIAQLHAKKPDGFLEALLTTRPDLAGLPFQMGSDCRLSQTRGRYLEAAATIVHDARNEAETQTGNSRKEVGAVFLASFLQGCSNDEKSARIYDEDGDAKREEHTNSARIAAIMQICGPTRDSSVKLAMIRYLASISSADSTRALVKIVLYTPEKEVRSVAIEALRTRRDKDFVDPLLQGFRYPWPDVSERVGEALVKLKRKDLIPRIIDVLDEPDPRAPVTAEVDGKTVTMVREVVRINHHRNCAMCHAPGQEVKDHPFVMTAQAPVAGQALPSFNSGGYSGRGGAVLLVRIDVTYLRQDFSMMLRVADAAPWPEMQRFDFVARTRILKDDEMKAYEDKFNQLAPGILPPNHQAALAALRQLTGKNTVPSAAAWRKLVAMVD